MTLKEQARQSGLVHLDERAEWDENEWPPLEGGWRDDHATVVLNHPFQDNNNTDRLSWCWEDGNESNALQTPFCH